MSACPEMVVVEVAFTTKVFFYKKALMPRETYNRLNQRIKDGEDVYLTEWIDWDNPTDFSESDVHCFDIQQQ